MVLTLSKNLRQLNMSFYQQEPQFRPRVNEKISCELNQWMVTHDICQQDLGHTKRVKRAQWVRTRIRPGPVWNLRTQSRWNIQCPNVQRIVPNRTIRTRFRNWKLSYKVKWTVSQMGPTWCQKRSRENYLQRASCVERRAPPRVRYNDQDKKTLYV